MPQLVSLDIASQFIRKGDLFAFTASGGHRVVDSIKRATKYMHVTDVDGKTTRYEVGQTISVSRSEPTAEERMIEKRAYCLRAIMSEIKTLDEQIVAAKDDMIKNMEFAGSHQWRPFERHIALQWERGMWTIVGRINDVSFDGIDMVSALASYIPDLEAEMIDGLDRQVTSRSTATGANYVEDIERGAKAAWLKSHRTWAKGTGATILDRYTGEPTGTA